MKIEQIFCDVCGCQITVGAAGYWDTNPSTLTLVMGGPGTNDGKVYFEHVCYDCRKGIRASVDAYVANRASKAPH